MRRIVLFNPYENSKDTLNIFAKLARQGKRVLLFDLRQSSSKQSTSEVGLDIASCLESPSSFSKYITSLEPNLDIIKGSSYLNTAEFRVFNSLFKFDVFEKQIEDLDYDYVVFELSFILDLFALNALFASSEVMVYHDIKTSAAYDIVKFIHDFNALYSHKILCSLVIAIYHSNLDRKKYTNLVSDFSSSLISFPFKLDKLSIEYKKALENISQSILELDKVFDPKDEFNWALKKQQEYEELINRISSQ